MLGFNCCSRNRAPDRLTKEAVPTPSKIKEQNRFCFARKAIALLSLFIGGALLYSLTQRSVGLPLSLADPVAQNEGPDLFPEKFAETLRVSIEKSLLTDPAAQNSCLHLSSEKFTERLRILLEKQGLSIKSIESGSSFVHFKTKEGQPLIFETEKTSQNGKTSR